MTAGKHGRLELGPYLNRTLRPATFAGQLLEKLRRRCDILRLRLTAPIARRRFLAFGVGLPKSGTHSLAGLLSAYRSAHEPMMDEVIAMAVARLDGDPVPVRRAIAARLRAMDKALKLELNSNNALHSQVDVLVQEFPDAKFILTIRDCYTWLDSIINTHLFENSASPDMTRFRDHFYQRDLVHSSQETCLRRRGLYTLHGYLARWTEHNRCVLSAVPPERLLVIRTNELSSSIPRIAEFLGVSLDTLKIDRAHLFKTPLKEAVLDEIDRSYLERKVDQHCRELMDRFFPDLRSIEDACPAVNRPHP